MLYIALKIHTAFMARLATEINNQQIPEMMADVTPTSIRERVRARIEHNHNEIWLITNTQTTARWDGKNERVIFI